MPAKKKIARKYPAKSLSSYKYKATRANNPQVGLVLGGKDRIEESQTWAYDAHLLPELQFYIARVVIEQLIDDRCVKSLRNMVLT